MTAGGRRTTPDKMHYAGIGLEDFIKKLAVEIDLETKRKKS